MSPTLPKKALISITSYCEPFYEDGSKTGLFYGEASHPWHVLTKAGFEVDFASESGSYGLDDHSTSEDFLSKEDIAELNDPNSECSKAFKKIKKASDINADEYGIFFASAGHATLFDYPTASTLQSIASEIYNNGGIVSTVCHGGSIFANLMDKKTGEHLVKGKKVTGFTDIGEDQMGITSILEKYKLKTVQTIAEEVGATYVHPPTPFGDWNLTDGRVVTGVNPASAHSTAVAVVEAFNKL
ncbi:hypothetical protein BABINDRAFT_163171 [Babjeviella inositovora NRRL Y-12698]|uniref:D-lactate dehydratase n=1 Tax=Babjeviella inositovora NRRL Y-12698 TaxID=984486 RepID=A0A1E3QJ79_9ASCO|nr:uncharacterized protein BABINDRAFT_163171 [Babjeviella inositovora NRRL Y-12698]ODQ77773.1 hypothetical protein BABINDRAFT_163171 [Babjeviella inositovora NRRL Y-12698]